MEPKVAINRTVTANSFYMQPVEIIIPFHNRPELVTNLLNDIYVTVSKNPYLITLVDDGSRNTEFIKAIAEKKLPNVRTIIHKEHRGFGAAVNNALRLAPKEKINWVCILHSDVRLKDPNWLFNLGVSMNALKEQGVKMLSPLTDNPGGGSPLLKASKASAEPDQILEDGFLPMYCAFSHRMLFNAIGFLPEYPYAGNEAEEFAITLRKRGYKQGICMSSWVHHQGRGTLSQYDNRPKVQEILRKSREAFVSKKENPVVPAENKPPE